MALGKIVLNLDPLANKILLVSGSGWCCLDSAGRFFQFMQEVHHLTAYFIGHVQGVGFRYQTLQIAKEFEVSGFVKNLPDGRVQLEIEGRPAEIHDFSAAVQERLAGYIRKVEQTEAKRAPKFSGFSIQ